jgi:4-pyridoxate dehydrogenase
MLRAYFFGSGPATVLPGGLHGFLQSVPGLAAPDLQFAFRAVANDAHLWFPGIVKPYGDEISMRTILLHPKSRGEVLLRSANPRDKPRIVHDFLSHPDDMPILRRGVRIIREIFAQKVLDRWRGKELRPGEAISTDGAIDGYIRKTASTTSHPASTCRMGTGDGAVVDSDLRLRGVQGLRVVDASVMPDLVSGNINACVLMIAERASDLIRGRTPLAPATGI